MRYATFALAILLGSCCVTGGGGSAPSMPTGPGGPGAAGCPDLASSIVGTWTLPGFVEEYRADGTYVINGQVGTFRWARPGHATLDVPSGGLHDEYDLGLADATTLLASSATGSGSVYTRTSPPPSIPPGCFDLSTAFVATWMPVGGGTPERYDADGTYSAPGVGRWSFSLPGRLHLVRDDGVASDYVVGMATPTTMLAVSMPPLAPRGVVYDRAR